MSILSPPMLFRLDHACKPIAEAFGHEPYLVGSVQQRTAGALSDVDIRLILPDDEYDALFAGALNCAQLRTVLDLAMGAFLRELTGLPIDFQIQRMTQANERHKGGQRNPLGGRTLAAWIGDASPKTAQERLADRARMVTTEAAEAALTQLDKPATKARKR